jgi:capsular polysaccharide biosynthesis protein
MKKMYVVGLFIVVICAVAGYIYSAYFDKDMYVSDSQVIVLRPKSTNQVSDYANIVTTRRVLESVRSDIGYTDSIESLESMIKSAVIPGTNMFTIKVTTSSPSMSRDIALSATRQLDKRVEALFGENNTKIVDEVSNGAKVDKRSPVLSAAFGAGTGLVLFLLLVLVAYDTPKQRSARESSDTEEKKDDITSAEDKKPLPDSDAEKISSASDTSTMRPVTIQPVGYKYSGRSLSGDTKREHTSFNSKKIQ